MMDTLQTILAIILTPTLIVGAIVFVLRQLFQQLLSKDLENHKANLQFEFENSKMRLENELQSKLFEFQTKFSAYHQKQAEVIGELYEMLSETEMIVSILVHPVQFDDGRAMEEKISEAHDKKVSLARFFNRRRIYLDEDVCQKMETVIKALQKAVVRFGMSQRERRGTTHDMDMWGEAFKVMEEELPPIKQALERKFRQILSAGSGDQTEQTALATRPSTSNE